MYCYSQDGETALMKATCNGHVTVALMLIEAGTDIHVQAQVTVQYNTLLYNTNKKCYHKKGNNNINNNNNNNNNSNHNIAT